MQNKIILIVLLSYLLLLYIIAKITSKGADNQTFFLGNRKAPWYIIAFGMISASLSGITFISLPGWVVNSNFYYMQMVLGYLVGYALIAHVLLPTYYRHNVTSIYMYLNHRLGPISYKTGASVFLISRLLGASLRVYLVALVLQYIICDAFNIPFMVTVLSMVFLIWLYTHQGGIKTIIWTDFLQTFSLLAALIATIVIIAQKSNLSFINLVDTIYKSPNSAMFYFDDINSKYHFVKQFISGALIALVMTGLDQDIMQKNLSCKNINDAKKNIYSYSFLLVPVNLLFLSLGALLVWYYHQIGLTLPEKTDEIFPMIATNGTLPIIVSILFTIGLVAVTFSSADSALTSLTTSFTLDILGMDENNNSKLHKTRKIVHMVMALAIALCILLIHAMNNKAIIDTLFSVAAYTYGPLLGLFSFAMLTKYKVKENWVPLIAILAPLITYLIYLKISANSKYEFSYETLLINAAIVFFGLFIIKTKKAVLMK